MWIRDYNINELRNFPDYYFKGRNNNDQEKERLRICKYPNQDIFTVYYTKIVNTGKPIEWAQNEIEWNMIDNYKEELPFDEIKQKYQLDI